MWNPHDPLGYLCPIVTVNGQVQIKKGVISKVSEHSRVKVWVTPPGKPPGSAEKITEGEVNFEWTVEEGEDE